MKKTIIVIFALLVFNSCSNSIIPDNDSNNSKDTIQSNLDTIKDSTPVDTVRIGSEINGGIVYYVDSTGLHGLIAAARDIQVNGMDFSSWGAYNKIAGATDKDNGENNIGLTASCTGFLLLRYCHNFNLLGYNDWYLPSYNELNLLKKKRDLVGGFPSNSKDAIYWSSSETDSIHALAVNMIALMGDNVPKDKGYKIRLIKKF